MQSLAAWAGASQQGRPEHRTLTESEVHALCQGGLVDVGAHTVSHPVLSKLSDVEQEAEIVNSKSELERIVGRPILGLAYPFGTRADYSKTTTRLTSDAGFAYACSNFPETVHWQSDCYQLPRFLVRDWSADEFSHHLEEWFAA